jgi:hypothetical protein
MNTHVSRALLALVFVPCALSAQTGTSSSKAPAKSAAAKASKTCTMPDTTGAWFKTQRDFQRLDDKHDWTDDSLRNALVDAARSLSQPSTSTRSSTGPDIEIGATPVVATGAVSADASVNSARDILRAMAAKRQWPTRSMVGVAGVHAAWLISRDDTTLAKAAMHRMMEAGPGEASPADVAVLEDRLRLENGRKQIYASQIQKMANSSKYEPAPTEDLAHVDMRREAAGLPRLAQSLCAANAAVPSTGKPSGGQ